eukprot:gene9122-9291_t
MALAAAEACQESGKAQNKVADAFKANNLTLFPTVVELAGATKAAADPKQIWTAVVPTDAAVQSFLTEMGLTAADLKSRPGLAKKLLAVHAIIAGNLGNDQIFEANRTARIVAPVGGRNDNLIFLKGKDGKVTVRSPQGTVANVVKVVPVDEFKTIHIIDKVLLGEGYYTSFASLCASRDLIKDFCQALIYAGLADTVDSKAFSHTVLVPNNAAIVAAELNLNKGNAPSQAQTADILKYHVLAGPAKEIPTGIKAGSVDTLLGQPLTVKFAETKVGGKSVLNATFTSTSGNTAEVLVVNVYVGRSIVNGVNQVLIPKVAAAAAAAPAKSGRRLLGFGWGASAGSTYAEDASANAIYQAASGVDTAYNAVETSQQLATAESDPGTLNRVSQGIEPW